MAKRAYDTRTRDEILAGDRFAPFAGNPGLAAVELRALRTLDRFLTFADERGICIPTAEDFLAIALDGTSTRRLDDLRQAFDQLLPEGAGVREAVRDAIRIKKPRSRACDRRSRRTLLAEDVMKPYRDLPGIEGIALEDLRVLSRFLSFVDQRRIEAPDEAAFLAFVADVSSSRRLRSLKAAFAKILPEHPVLLPLEAAIRTKSPARISRAGAKQRPAAERRVPLADLPADWQDMLARLRLGVMPSDVATAPATSVIDSMEDTLREYACVQRDASADVALTVEGLRRLLDAKKAASEAKTETRYQNEGNRAATRHTAVVRLRQFATLLGIEPLVLSAFKMHESELRRQRDAEVPLKFAKLDSLPDLPRSWAIATDLLDQASVSTRKQTRIRLLNEAVVVALWMFLPLRLEDSQLLWGTHITFDGCRYHLDIETHKAGEPLRGPLHPMLVPFFDALVCRGIDLDYVQDMRSQAMAKGLPLFRNVADRVLSKTYPSTVWRKHFETGAHISRSRIHTELGALGLAGVEAALALNAQRDPGSAAHYTGQAVSRARMERGQAMIDDLVGDALAEG